MGKIKRERKREKERVKENYRERVGQGEED